jgi:DNA polymerase III subunit beta
MRFTASRSALLRACQLVGSATASGSSSKPILQNILATSTDGLIRLEATDMEVGVRVEMAPGDVDILRGGDSAVFPVGKLTAILRETPDDRVTVEADGKKCTVDTLSSTFEMPVEDPQTFPAIGEFEPGESLTITVGNIKALIHRVSFAAAKQDTKYAITGVLWEVNEGQVRLVATDTRRLAMSSAKTVDAAEAGAVKSSGLIPVKALALLEKSLPDDDAALVVVAVDANAAQFKCGGLYVRSRLLEGRFPPYSEIIPKRTVIKIPVKAQELMRTVRQAAIMADADAPGVTLAFADGKLRISTQGQSSGKSKVEMPIDYTGQPLNIRFDPHYVVDYLKSLPAETSVVFEANDSGKPAIFRDPVGDNLYLVMPLNLA